MWQFILTLLVIIYANNGYYKCKTKHMIMHDKWNTNFILSCFILLEIYRIDFFRQLICCHIFLVVCALKNKPAGFLVSVYC